MPHGLPPPNQTPAFRSRADLGRGRPRCRQPEGLRRGARSFRLSQAAVEVGWKGVTAFFCAKAAPIASRKFMERRNERGQQFQLVESSAPATKRRCRRPSIPETLKPYQWRNASLEEVRRP